MRGSSESGFTLPECLRLWPHPRPPQRANAARRPGPARLLSKQLTCAPRLSSGPGPGRGSSQPQWQEGPFLLLRFLITKPPPLSSLPPPPRLRECYEWNVRIPACERAQECGHGDLPTPPTGGGALGLEIGLAWDGAWRAQRLSRTLGATGPAVCSWGVRRWPREQKPKRPGAHSPHQDSAQAHSRLSPVECACPCTRAHSVCVRTRQRVERSEVDPAPSGHCSDARAVA